MDTSHKKAGLSPGNALLKRSFDFVFSLLGITATWWLMVISWALATADTGQNGFFTQTRVGRNGKLFRVLKIRTMRDNATVNTTVTTSSDSRITYLGRLFRKTKIDELPQLLNVLLGHMSFVGPRPDVPGFADRLGPEDSTVLTIRPGITGPATLKYKNEEQMLSEQDDPETYNSDVIFPDKVRINKQYIENYSFRKDLIYIWKTVIG